MVLKKTAAIFISCAAGVLLGFLVRVNAALGEQIGMLEATLVIHVVGTIFAALLISRRLSPAFAQRLARGPRHELAGGLFSVAMVFISNLVVSHLGVALAVSLFIVSDLLFSSVADQAGLLRLKKIPLTPRRVVGLVIAIAGVLLIRWA